MYLLSRSDSFKLIIPPVLACVLFIVTLFGVVLPVSKNNLLEQKKNSIAVLTQAASKILYYYYRQAQSGELDQESAQIRAVEQIRELRFGTDHKDYFWINDLHPRMIMHPYRPDLEGQNLQNFKDKNQKNLFVEFVEKVNNEGSGYVPYYWQLNDNPDHITPKLSYVSLFEPWGWIIGTGIYLDEVQREFAHTSKKLVFISGLILLIITFLTVTIIRHGIRETKKRRFAEKELQKHYDQLELLVKERTVDLEKALSKVKLLSGFLPICASCKKIRDDKGYWSQIESYIKQHSEAEFSHSICPECVEKLYPGLIPNKNSTSG